MFSALSSLGGVVKSAPAPTGFPQNDYTYFTTSLTGSDVTYT